jgi:hypothetical protein
MFVMRLPQIGLIQINDHSSGIVRSAARDRLAVLGNKQTVAAL